MFPWPGWLVLLVILTGHTAATAGPLKLSGAYVQKTALVFKSENISKRQLPYRTRLAGGRMVYANQIMLACFGVAALPGEMLVYVPDSKACFTMTDLSVSAIEQNLGKRSVLGLKKDKTLIRKHLSEQTIAVLESSPSEVFRRRVCVCPPKPEPIIFIDGFENGS
jgi:hypothetical protein